MQVLGFENIEAGRSANSEHVRQYLVRRLSLGITARLTISFAAVAILAAAANLIVEHGVRIVHTIHIARSTDTASQTASTSTRKRFNADKLALAVDRFERSMRSRAAIDSPEAITQFQRASMELDKAWTAFRAEAPAGIGALDSRFEVQLKTYKQYGQGYLRLSDTRRQILSEYSTQFEAMNAQIEASLDGAWKIFGHVLARQSLMRLRADLDILRRRFASISTVESYERNAIDAVAVSEASVEKTIDTAEKGLLRSEGKQWMERLRSEFTAILTLRTRLVDVDTQRRLTERRFSEQAISVATNIPAQLVPRIERPDTSQQVAATPAPALAARPNTGVPDTSTVIPIDADVTTTTTAPSANGRRALVAWISTGVLTLLSAISFFTVRSVLVPVRKMLIVTTQLASGHGDARVPRGGIKELDTLGVAFNQMADQLAAANEAMHAYQHHLKAKVEDRTRQLQHLAEHDPLTELPNRRQLFVLLNAAIGRAAITRCNVGVFFIDIDNFKNLNDSMGHAFGDRVLMSIAKRLDQTARCFGFAARLGGDEFMVVYDQAPTADAVREAGWGLVQAFQKPLMVDDRELIVSVSVGASLYPDHELEAEALLRAADVALFRAKALGRSQLAVFTPDLLQAATSRFTTEQGLRRAIERGEFELVYQPEISLDTMELGLVEALIRWRLPDGRLALPGEFLAVAEESGLIVEIGDWVLRTAIETAARWHHGAWPDVRVAINVTARQLLDQHFADRVQELLQEFQLPPRCIEIELTETVLQTGPATIESLRRLRSYDIDIALDDFGTGYSSLSSLEHLPLSRVKLDRSLIASIDTSSRSAAIARAIISLCSSLDLAVTAEGIERTDQFSFLLGNRSMHVQGFLIAPPVSSDELLLIKASIGAIMSDLLLSIPALPDSAAVAEIPSAKSVAGRTRRHT